MKYDGLTFLALIVIVLAFIKLIWSYLNLFYEVQDLKKRLGKS